MQEFAARMQLTAGKLLTTKGSRLSIAVQLPTAILRNMGVYLKYIDWVRTDKSDMDQLLVTA